MKRVFYTYLWTDPKGNIPIYVGKGKKNRAWSHVGGKSHLGNTIRKRRAEGYTMEPMVSFWDSEDEAYSIERLWISIFGRADTGTGTLFNRSDGGEKSSMGYRASKETRDKMSRSRKGKPGCWTGKTLSEQHRQSIKDALARRKAEGLHVGTRAKTLTQEHRAAIRAGQARRIWTPEDRAAWSEKIRQSWIKRREKTL